MARQEHDITVVLQQVSPEPEWIDFEGEHIRIDGVLAWLYKALRIVNGIENAERELYPHLKTAKIAAVAKREAAADRHRATAQLSTL